MHPLSRQRRRPTREGGNVAVVTPEDYLQRQRELWTKHTCPFCGQKGKPSWLCILSTYTLQCPSCDEVVESFELYSDRAGRLIVENHFRALGRVPGAKAPSYERVGD